jgi:hypothetical protein
MMGETDVDEVDLFGEARSLNGFSVNSGQGRRGSAGHLLAIADLKIRGFDAADMEGIDTDIVADIYGIIRRFQVKSSQNGTSFGPGGQSDTVQRRGVRPLYSYRGKIDAFAFVLLARRLVYYIYANAIITRSITIKNLNSHSCDLSFSELLRRWKQDAGEEI